MSKNTLLSLLAGAIIFGGGIWIYKSNTASVIPPDGTNTNVVDPDGDGDNHLGTGSATDTTPPAGAATGSEQDVKAFTVSAQNFSFAPASITVKKGDKVRITLDNTSGFHDLKIDEFGVATKRIQGGQKDVVEFVADKVGSFEYYCSVGEHRQMGMRGTLVVQ